MNNYQSQIKILLCFIIMAGVILFDGTGPGICRTSTNWTIHSQVTDGGGGACNSDNYRLCFSLGQTSAVGVSENDTKRMSSGFITGVAKKAPAAETSTDSSCNSNSCFIRTLLPD